MGEKYMTPSAVIVLILRQNGERTEVLCQRRINTGFGDGKFDFSYSGKVEEGECMTCAAAREAVEELDIRIKPEDFKFMCFVHKRDEDYNLTYINVYLTVERYDGEIKIAEPDKCSEIKWFDINNLPDDILEDRKEVLLRYLDGEKFIEYGWETKK